MENSHHRPVNKIEFEKEIIDAKDNKKTIIIECNNSSALIEIALSAAAKMSAIFNKYEVYYQKNPDFDYATLKLCSIDDSQKLFEDYYNYYEKNKITKFRHVNKSLINYSSKEPEEFILAEYPTNKKIILLVENFNFWDSNSQFWIAKLRLSYPDMIIIAQKRTDFEFVNKRINMQIFSHGLGKFLSLDY